MSLIPSGSVVPSLTTVFHYLVSLYRRPRSWRAFLTFLTRTGSATVFTVLTILAIETSRHKRNDLPTESTFGHYIWGHAIKLGWIVKDKRHQWAFELARRILDRHHTMTSYVAIPFLPTIIFINDPVNVEHVLKTNFTNYIKGYFFHYTQKPLLGNGIFNVDGHQWRVQRKAAAYIFNVQNFRDYMLKVFSNHSMDLTDRLNQVVDDSTVSINLYDLLQRFTLDAFMEIGFGTSIHSLRSITPPPFAIAFDTAQSITAKRMTMFYVQQVLTEFFTGTGRKLNKCVMIMNEFADHVIADRRKQLNHINENNVINNDNMESGDLLSRFIIMKNPDTDMPYTDIELRYVIMNFVIAGRDTTAQALSWTMYLLCQHPHVVTKIRNELDEHLGITDPDVSVYHLNATPNEYILMAHRLIYTKATFYEALRLYPSVPMEFKVAQHDDILPDGTKIYAGNRVVWPLYVMGRLTELWGPDALEFKPERWINSQGQFIQPNPFKYPVFNAGPRTCLGQQMAQLEGIACLITLLRNYDFELVDPESVQCQLALTLQMKNGLFVRVRRCNRTS